MEIARYWRMNNQRYTLTGSVCACCGKHHISPRPVCDACQNHEASTTKSHTTVAAMTALEPAHK